MAEVCKGGDNTLSSRTVPIIFVPGVMGSKLHFTEIDQDWDPDSNWAMSHWLVVSAEEERWQLGFEAIATVFDQAPPPSKGWASVAQGFYQSFLFFLNGLKSLCAKAPVYAVGYDWRQSNLASGAWLDSHITAILNQEQAENFILISHSMGGIVCRSCLLENRAGNSDKLLGVIHIFQPATGAPAFYGRMYTGATKPADGDGHLCTIQGNSPDKFATILSGLRGPCELIPNEAYEDIDASNVSGPWLWDDRATPPQPFPTPIFDRYLEATAPAGITWSVAGTTHSLNLASRLREARTFHARLKRFRHARTWALYGTGLPTDVAARFAATGANHGIQRQRRNSGDATVPRSSGSALFGTSATRSDMTGKMFSADSSIRQCEVTGVEHAAACGNSGVQTVVEQMLLVALGCCGPIKDPADAGHPLPEITPPANTAVASADNSDSETEAGDPGDSDSSSPAEEVASNEAGPDDSDANTEVADQDSSDPTSPSDWA